MSPQDDAEAVRWFRLAAEQGEAFAQQRLDAILKSQAGTAETAPQPARVVVNRLPRIGDPLPGEEAADVGQADEGEEESTEVAALEPSESTAVDVTDGDAESAPVVVEGSGALYANSVPFDRVDGEPVMAVVLIDDPNANTNLGALPISVTIAVASDSVGSVQRAQQHRKAGREVVLIPPITGSDSRTDIARRLTEAMQNIPEAVAVMDMPGQAFQRSRFAVGEVMFLILYGKQLTAMGYKDSELEEAIDAAKRILQKFKMDNSASEDFIDVAKATALIEGS